MNDKAEANITSDTTYLQSICKDAQYEDVREHLMSYNGVGPKVADCVCLMGLHMDGIVPVDVHVSRIAKRDYQISANKNHLKELRTKYNALPISRKKINLELDHIRLMLLKNGDHTLVGPKVSYSLKKSEGLVVALQLVL